MGLRYSAQKCVGVLPSPHLIPRLGHELCYPASPPTLNLSLQSEQFGTHLSNSLDTCTQTLNRVVPPIYHIRPLQHRSHKTDDAKQAQTRLLPWPRPGHQGCCARWLLSVRAHVRVLHSTSSNHESKVINQQMISSAKWGWLQHLPWCALCAVAATVCAARMPQLAVYHCVCAVRCS